MCYDDNCNIVTPFRLHCTMETPSCGEFMKKTSQNFCICWKRVETFFFSSKNLQIFQYIFFFYVKDSTKFGCEIKTYQIMEFVFRMVIRMVYSWSNNCCVIYNLGYTFVHIWFCKRWLAMNFLDTCIMFFFFLLRKIKFDVLMIT